MAIGGAIGQCFVELGLDIVFKQCPCMSIEMTMTQNYADQLPMHILC